KPSRIRYGNVEAVGGGLASVRMGSAVVDNATWCRGYAPIVGDRVAVLASGSGWLILDAVERVQRAYNEPETMLIQPDGYSRIANTLWSESSDGSYSNPAAPPRPPERLTEGWRGGDRWDWSWSDPELKFYESVNYFFASAGDGDAINYVPSNGPMALMTWYDDIAARVPDDAIIQSISLVIRLWDPSGDIREEPLRKVFYPANPATVTIHAHSHDGSTQDGNPPEYFFDDDQFDPIVMDQLHPGDVMSIPLPDDWTDALVDGSMKGLGFWEPTEDIRTGFVNEQEPYWYVYQDYPGRWMMRDKTKDCLGLQVTYITPYEDD